MNKKERIKLFNQKVKFNTKYSVYDLLGIGFSHSDIIQLNMEQLLTKSYQSGRIQYMRRTI